MKPVTPFRLILLALCVWGTVHPMYWFLTYMNATGTGLSGLIDAWYVNASTTGLTWDLTIAAVALTLWTIVDSYRRRDGWGLLAIPATFGVGLSLGLPLYLFLRGRDRG